MTSASATAEILFERRGRAGLVTLNRARALNSLTLDMVRQLHVKLANWAADPAVERVIVKAAGERAFCAGGDIRQLFEWGRSHDPLATAFYREEYRLNAYIKRYPKPYIPLIDGIVMGGGVGISVHGSHRVVGSRTLFAMPETGIGLFPDVGGTYFLPRLPGRVGTWLALTGARLEQYDCLWAGIATHAISSDSIPALCDALIEAADLEAALSAYSEPPTSASAPTLQGVIDRCFDADSIEDVLSRLKAVTGQHAAWASETAQALRKKSPISLRVTMRQMHLGALVDFEDCMRIEFRIVSRMLQGHDFFEGVRAVIVDKDNAPRWWPARLKDVAEADVEAYFAPLGSDELDLSTLACPV